MDISMFCKDRTRPDGLHSWCKICRSARGKAYYKENKEEILTKNKKWSENNKERHRELVRQNNRDRKGKNPDFWKPYYEENKSEYAARTAKRRATKKQATPDFIDEELVKFFYKAARWLNLEVDHIVPLQSDIVCGLHYELNLQLLPMSENRAKGNRLEER